MTSPHKISISSEQKRIEELEAALRDPVVVHLNMLRGGIALPSVANIVHLYGAEVLREALPEAGLLAEIIDLLPHMADDDPMAPALAAWRRRARDALSNTQPKGE